MDFSLLQFHSRHFCLRDILALKKRWPYYTIMVVDPALRFSWIFYAIFTHNTQHSTIFSFLVSLLEVVRRGVWALFRVENEHCANVSQYKASRDVPLPYRIEPLMDRSSTESSPQIQSQEQTQQTAGRTQAQTSSQQPSRWGQGVSQSSSTAVASTLGTLRRRADTSSARTFSKILAEAHKQDFEKRRKPAEEAIEDPEIDNSDDDDDESIIDEREAVILRNRGESRGDGTDLA